MRCGCVPEAADGPNPMMIDLFGVCD